MSLAAERVYFSFDPWQLFVVDGQLYVIEGTLNGQSRGSAQPGYEIVYFSVETIPTAESLGSGKVYFSIEPVRTQPPTALERVYFEV